ncbi:hypothetical protein AQZ49_19860 [Novosphingobium sp. FSW06-99]|nr:phage tail length tape measure family protein [Novosphingobium sp. FSW06-99]KUR73858.1 hypothetical protein AQZ49_19860 [Novosphingobium sp. FSW06-99]
MTSNVQVKVTGDIADLRVQMAAAEAVMKKTAIEANNAAKAIAMGDTSKEAAAKNLALTQSLVDAKSAFRGLSNEYKTLTEAQKLSTNAGAAFLAQLREQAATAGMSQKQMLAYRAEQLGVANDAKPLIAAMADTSHGSAGVTRELLVMGRELSRGNFNRMAGSATILAGRLGILTPSVVGTAAAIASIVAPIALASVAAYQFDQAQNDLLISTVGLGAASQLTASQLMGAAASAAQYSGVSIRAATEAASAFAGAGARSQAVVSSLVGSMKGYAALTGQDAADAQKKLAEAMHDPVRGAEELNAELGILDSTQIKQIRTMSDAGDKAGAVAVIAEALRQRVDQAKSAGAEFNTIFSKSVTVLSDDYEWLGRVSAAYVGLAERVNIYNLATGNQVKQAQAQAAAAQSLQNLAQLKEASGQGAAIVGTTPEARDAEQREKLAGSMKILQAALAADTKLHGANSDAVRADQAALADYKRAIDTYLPSAEKAHRLAELDQQLAEARKGKDSGRIADLTRQKTALDTAGEVMSPQDAAQRANDAAATAADKTRAPKAKDDRVQQWTEQLREMKDASKDYFADEAAMDLSFWQGKLAAARSSATALREVEAHIHEANKTLARQAYEAQIADYNDQIEAAKGNWDKQKAIIAEKVAYIDSKQHEESRAFQDALKEQERAQQEHILTQLRQDQEAGAKVIENLRQQVATRKQISDEEAKIATSAIKDKEAGSFFGGAAAAKQEAAVKIKAIQDEIAATTTLQATQDAQLQKNVEAARAAGDIGVQDYKKAVAAKEALDAEWAAKQKALQDRLREEQQASIAAQKAAYASYISGTVNATVTGFSKMIAGQESFKQLGIGIYSSIVREVEQQVAKMATDWIVKHVLMAAASKLLGQSSAAAAPAGAAATVAAAKTSVVALAAQAGAAGVASMAAAPWPLDIGAPEFGGAMESAALALGSFAVGTNFVPTDMVAQIHAGERIIPKADNAALMQMTSRGAASGADSGGGRGGDTHNHFSPTIHAHGADGKAIVKAIESNFSDFHRMMRNKARVGAFS